ASPIAFVIAAILAVVVFSYRQTIHAYPTGGGAYLVSKDNLGEMPALIAAAALLIDYILTVAVSIAAGVAAITSAFPQWHVNRVEMTLGFVVVLMLGNLRGIRESGRIFSVPTYFFIVATLVLIAVGAWRAFAGSIHPIVAEHTVAPGHQALTWFLLLKAFADGCSAARVDSRARSLRPSAVHEPGRPPRVFQRHRRPQHLRGNPADSVPRRHACAHSFVHDRRVRVVHAVAGRDGRALVAAAGAGL